MCVALIGFARILLYASHFFAMRVSCSIKCHASAVVLLMCEYESERKDEGTVALIALVQQHPPPCSNFQGSLFAVHLVSDHLFLGGTILICLQAEAVAVSHGRMYTHDTTARDGVARGRASQQELQPCVPQLLVRAQDTNSISIARTVGV